MVDELLGAELIVLGVALFVIVLVRLSLRWRRTSPLERLQLTPVYSCGLLAFLLVTMATAGAGDALWWPAFIATAILPFAFLAGLLRSHVARLDAQLHARLQELRGSRARLVHAGDTERRRLERNLHDGAQARLVGVTLLLAHARRRVTDDAGLPVPSSALGVSLAGTPVTTGMTACGSDTPLTSENVKTDESGISWLMEWHAASSTSDFLRR